MFRYMANAKLSRRNLRAKSAGRYKIKAADIVAGTGLTDSQVAEIYNPASSVTGTRFRSRFCQSFDYLRTAHAIRLINIDYLMGDHQLALYLRTLCTKRMLNVHLRRAKAAALNVLR